MSSREEQSLALQLTNAEQDVATLTQWWPLIDVYVDPNGQANALGSIWTVYSIADGVTARIAAGVLNDVSQPIRVLAQVPGSGDTIKLTVRSPKGATSAVALVKGVIVGWQLDASISPDESFASGSQPLDGTNAIYATLLSAFPGANVTVNGNGQANAVRSKWTLLGLLAAGFEVALAVAELADPNVEQQVIAGFQSGAAQYRVRGKSVFGATPGNVTAAVSGFTSTGPGSAATVVTLAGNVVGSSNANTLQSVSGGFGGHAGFVSVDVGAFFGFDGVAVGSGLATAGDLRWGDVQSTARTLVAGRNAADTANVPIFSTDGFGTIIAGGLGGSSFQNQANGVLGLSTSAGTFQVSPPQNALLAFEISAFKTQSVTGAFVFDSVDALLTAWKIAINGTELAQITPSKWNPEKGQRDAVTLITDASYSIQQTDYTIALASTPTANRTFTLPSLASSVAGDEYEVTAGALAGFTLNVAPSGTDKINGANAAIAIPGDYASARFKMISATEGWRTL